jgi:hypothetical protein
MTRRILAQGGEKNMINCRHDEAKERRGTSDEENEEDEELLWKTKYKYVVQ